MLVTTRVAASSVIPEAQIPHGPLLVSMHGMAQLMACPVEQFLSDMGAHTLHDVDGLLEDLLRLRHSHVFNRSAAHLDQGGGKLSISRRVKPRDLRSTSVRDVCEGHVL